MAEAHAFGPASAAFPGTLAGAGLEVEPLGTGMNPNSDVEIGVPGWDEEPGEVS